MKMVIRTTGRTEIEEAALVLSSQSIPFHIVDEPDGFAVYVPSAFAGRAREHLGEYSQESTPNHSPPAPVEYAFSYGVPLGIIALLISVHAWRATLLPQMDITGDFANTMAALEEGEWYRLATSLFLHVDVRHLMGNCASLLLFGSFLCGRIGSGVSSFLMLYCGILGNICSVVVRDESLHSMGASTSVFGSLGVLVGIRMFGRNENRTSVHPWMALGAGLALLGFLGTGERVDIFAHFGGFAFGVLSGILYHILERRRASNRIQNVFGVITLFTVVVSWLRLMRT